MSAQPCQAISDRMRARSAYQPSSARVAYVAISFEGCWRAPQLLLVLRAADHTAPIIVERKIRATSASRDDQRHDDQLEVVHF